jgi:hypothetical protein
VRLVGCLEQGVGVLYSCSSLCPADLFLQTLTGSTLCRVTGPSEERHCMRLCCNSDACIVACLLVGALGLVRYNSVQHDGHRVPQWLLAHMIIGICQVVA